MPGAGMAVESRVHVCSDDCLVRCTAVGGCGRAVGDGAKVPQRRACAADALFGYGGFVLSFACLSTEEHVCVLVLIPRPGLAPSSHRMYSSVDDRLRVLGGGSICRRGFESPL